MNELKEDAEKMRLEGYSYRLINERLGIPVSTMSYWFRDKPFTPNQEVLDRIKNGPGKAGLQRHNERREEVQSLRELGAQELGTLSNRDIWLLGLGLYIGEGSKTTEQIRIVNSDPAVVRMSIRWFKEACGLKDENLGISLHIYPDNDPNECMQYWKKVTGLKAENFRWISVDRRTNKKRSHAGKLLYGTAHITVVSKGNKEKGVRLFRRINGWIYGAMNQV